MIARNRQVRQFASFLFAVMIATSVVYHIINRNLIVLASARRQMTAGRYSEALSLYKQLAEKNFQPEQVFTGLAECHFALDQPANARVVLQLLVSDNRHNDPILLRKLAASALWLGLHEEAAEEYRAVLNLIPDDRVSRLGLARSLAWSGHYEKAVMEYRIILGD